MVLMQCGGGSASSNAPDASADASTDATTDGGTDSEAAVDGRVEAGTARLVGAVQKGPFVLGSSVLLSAINAGGATTGQVFTTQTTDDLGDFSVTFSYQGYVDMSAQGFYYNEVTGALSTAPIVLRALYDLASGGPQLAYINIVTHLAHDRALALLANGNVTLQAAESQAEGELFAALSIGGAGFMPGGPGVTMNEVGVDDDTNAYLFGVSAVLAQAAKEQAGPNGSVDAQLQELIDTISADLASSGTLPSNLVAVVQTAQHDLDVDLAMDLFAARLAQIGSTGSPANLNRAIDSDGDGYRNAADSCPLVANPNQAQVPAAVLCRATRHTAFMATSAIAPSCAIVGDFTGSGHPGILTCGLLSGVVGFSTGDGSGRFSAPSPVSIPPGFVPTLAFDVNGDGKLDLANPSGWVAGTGSGSFGSLSAFSAPFASGIVFGDVNGDHVPDALGVNAAGGLSVALATAPGVFSASAAAAMPSTVSGSWVFLGDTNGDGRVDAVEIGSAAAVSWLGQGNGTFVEAEPVPLTASGAGGAALADVDGDAVLDAVVWTAGSAEVAFGDGNGRYPSVTATLVSGGSIAAGDFNADGKEDLWVAGYSGSNCAANVDVWLSAGRTFVPPQHLHATPPTCGTDAALVTADLNGDGTVDATLVAEDSGATWTLQGYVVGACPGCECAGSLCGGACVDTTRDSNNCGGCGLACVGGQSCSASSCKCPSSEVSCSGACVDTRTSNANCGGCGNACPAAGSMCQSSICGCPSNTTLCSGVCVDTTGDNANCGNCGHSCPGGSTCQHSVCVCMGGGTVCNGACVDTTSDNANCGGCAVACTAPSPSTAQCISSRCVVTLATGRASPEIGISVDANNVYWTESGGAGGLGNVLEVPLSGGSPTTLASKRTSPWGLAVDSSNLYWAENYLGGGGGPYEIMKLPLGGGAPTTMTSAGSPFFVTVDSSNLYWTDLNGGIGQVALGGGSAVSLGTSANWGIGVRGGFVYAADNVNGDIMRVPSGGGSAITTASGENAPQGLCVDSNNVYWVDWGSGAVLQQSLAGGAVLTLASFPTSGPRGVAVDGTYVYWTQRNAGNIMKIPIGGGPATTIATTQAQPVGIAVDGTSVYWNDLSLNSPANGSVMKATPK